MEILEDDGRGKAFSKTVCYVHVGSAEADSEPKYMYMYMSYRHSGANSAICTCISRSA